MDTARRNPPRQTIPMDDLDLHPVRELRPRVLNDIEKETVVPPPRVQLNYVDVSFPNAPSKKGSPSGSIDKIRSHKRNHRTRNLETDRAAYVGNQMAEGNQQIVADDGNHQFIANLLRKGVPAWEEIPQDELVSRRIGFVESQLQQNHHPSNITSRSSSRTRFVDPQVQQNQNTSNITSRSSSRARKVPSAVWEDVADSCSHDTHQWENPTDAQMVSHRQIYHSKFEHNELKTVPSSSVSSSPSRALKKTIQSYPMDREAPVYCSKESSECQIPADADPRSSLEEHSSLENSQGSPHTLPDKFTQGTLEMDGNEHPVEQQRPLRIMKRKFGGRLVDDSNVITTKSWRIGEKAVLKKFGSSSKVESVKKKEIEDEEEEEEEEEKHEKEPTKEAPRKRDRSAPSRISEQPSKKSLKHTDKEELSKENVPLPPPRVRNYEITEVRKYMDKKRRERTKSNKEQKEREVMSQIEKEDRLKKLAQKTKEVALLKKPKETENQRPSQQASSQINHDPPPPPNWGCPSDCNHELAQQDIAVSTHLQSNLKKNATYSIQNECKEVRSIPSYLIHSTSGKTLSNNVQTESKPTQSTVYLVHDSSKITPKNSVQNDDNDAQLTNLNECSTQKKLASKPEASEKLKSRDKKRKAKKKLGNVSSESVSDLVSRTLEECDKQLLSSSVSLSGITTPTSIDLSEVETRSSSSLSESSSVGIIPNRRVVALGEMAQRLTLRIAEEEENFKQYVMKNNEKGTARPCKLSEPSINTEKNYSADFRAKSVPIRKDTFVGSAHPEKIAKENASHAQFQSLSVEELKTRMTAMLSRSTSNTQSKPDALNSNKDKEVSNKLLSNQVTKRTKPKVISPSREEYPNLLIPATPSLHLSESSGAPFGNSLFKKQKEVDIISSKCDRHCDKRNNWNLETLDMLPGNNVDVFGQKQVLVPSQITGNSSKAFSRDSGNLFRPYEQKKFETAAICIQAAYRGYRVRKVTNFLLRKRSSMENIVSPSKGLRNNPNEEPYIHDPPNQEIDWKKIREELASELYLPKRKSGYKCIRKDIPEWIKPYIALSETGNVDSFVMSNTKPSRSSVIKVKHSSNLVKIPGSRDCDENGSDKENDEEINDSEINDTLIEGPISDYEDEEHVLVSEKETQTHFKSQKQKFEGKLAASKSRHKYVEMKSCQDKKRCLLLDSSKRCNKESTLKKENTKDKESSVCMTSDHNDTLEGGPIDTLEEGPNDILEGGCNDTLEGGSNDTLEEGPLSDFEENICNDSELSQHESVPKFVEMKSCNDEQSYLLLDSSNKNNKGIKSFGKKENVKDRESLVCMTSNHNDTLEEGPIDTLEGGPNDTLEEGPLSDFEENLFDDSKCAIFSSTRNTDLTRGSDVMGTLRSKPIASNESLAPHQLLGEGPHFAPANLRLRLNAELMYQDTVNEALNQLHGAEQLHILTKNREREFAASQHLIAQQQEREEYKRISEGEKQKKAEEEERKASKELRRKEVQIQQETLSTVERIEKEAKARLDQLEKEVRARAEQIMIASQRPAEHVTAQPEFIATAAVAAVGATISQWDKLKQMQRVQSETLESQSAITHSHVTSISSSQSQRYSDSRTESQSKLSSTKSSASKKTSSDNSEKHTSFSDKVNGKKEKIISVGELPPEYYSSSSSVEELIHSEVESARSVVSDSAGSVVSEVTKISRSYRTSRSDSEIREAENLKSVGASNAITSSNNVEASIHEELKSSGSTGSQRLSRSKEKSPAPHFKTSKTNSSNLSEIASMPGVSTAKSFSNITSESVPSEVIETSKSGSGSTSVPSSDVKESIPISVPSTSKEVGTSMIDTTSRDSESIIESIEESKPSTSQESSRKLASASMQKDDSGDGGHYSESFEVESVSDSSSRSLELSQKRSEKEYRGDMSLVVSGNIFAAVDQMGYKGSSQIGKPFPGSALVEGGNNTALGITLSLVESLQKEEEVRLQHLTALIKLQEQSLIEEAKWKIAALQAEGGPRLRRRQDAISRQLREQRSHLHRLIETQNVAAQQRRLLLLQHHHLLATTSSISSPGNKGYPSNSRGHSPNPSSPRLTPRMMEIGISSSSEGQEDLSLHLSVKSKETGTSSLSDSSGREKRRSHSDERKRIASARLQEKRRAVDGDSLSKAKSIYDPPEKEMIKAKRKIDMVTKRSREKREKSPITSVRIGENTVSTESSVPEESIDASTHESQSSVAEEAGSESVSQSDVASSVSEHEGTSSRKEPSYSIPSKFTEAEKSSSIKEVLTNSKSDASPSSSKNISSQVENLRSKSDSIKESSRKSSAKSDLGSTIKTVSAESYETNKTSNIPTILSDKFSGQTNSSKSVASGDTEGGSKLTGTHSSSHSSSDVSEKQSKSRELSSSMEGTGNLKSNLSSSKNLSQIVGTNSSSSRLSDVKSTQRSSGRALPLPLRVPLSPRSPHRQHKRYSSESDDSFTLSQTETASDVSDGEGKLIALKEQLAVRRAEADRLRREKRRLRRERLTSQEHALRQQIANYDAYIQQAKLELERESKELQQASQVRPLIKKPQVAESKRLKQSESLIVSPEKSDISDTSILSECSKSDQSVSSKSQDGRSDHSLTNRLKNLKPDPPLPSKSQEFESLAQSQRQKISESQKQSPAPGVSLKRATEFIANESKKPVSESTEVTQEEVESSKESSTSISEDFSFEDESVSSQSVARSEKGSLSRESSQDTDHSQSQASSTETIVHSPKKLHSASQSVELDHSFPQQEERDDGKSSGNSTEKSAPLLQPSHEVEKKLEIFIPTHLKSEADESSYQDKDTSADESISEEIAEASLLEDIKDTESPEDSPSANISRREQSLSDKDHELSIAHEEPNAISKEDLITWQTPSIQDKKEQNEGDLTSHGTSLTKQRQVDDISNSILASLMKETTTFFKDIVKQKELNREEVSANSSKDSCKAISLEKPEQQEHSQVVTPDINVPSKENEDGTVVDSKSQVLKRVNDLIAENVSSPRSVLNSPRASGLQLTPQLTFAISPDTLSPASPTAVSPSKSSEELDPLKNIESGTQLSSSEAVAEDDSQGASPSHDIAKAEDYSLDTDMLTSKLLNLTAADIDLDSKLDLIESNTEFSVEGIEGTWFDDNFWTSSDNKKKQQQLKAEEERIAAEIARLEELQRLQEQYPGLVIREVPNKPPPPYTPPPSSPSPAQTMPPAYRPVSPEAQMSTAVESPSTAVSMPHRLSKADLRKLATEIFHVVPSSQEEVLPLVTESFECIYASFKDGIDPSTVEPPNKFLPSSSNTEHGNDTSEEEEESCAKIFSFFIFSLTRELLGEIYALQKMPVPPPWIKRSLPHTPLLMIAYTQSRETLERHVTDNVKSLFGWKVPSGKESLMLRWARKHRDVVDQVLVKELQAEEASWTRYDEDEAFVKSRAADEIFANLLDETIVLFSNIIVKKVAFTKMH